MSIFQMLALLIIGIIILCVGIKKKNKWLMIVSAMPLLAVLWQIILLVGMAIHWTVLALSKKNDWKGAPVVRDGHIEEKTFTSYNSAVYAGRHGDLNGEKPLSDLVILAVSLRHKAPRATKLRLL